eukprot:TRINITY_DN24344_c0_g1_i1.p1 TRINITY_DN24344_c0_g1~~TRINITY_DN24344_c0_g1_i1.p1  ORF type:complete len:263 (+),score=61.64 TRINITY_DN24344_c0_g1_i1:226-1014(+)
MSEEEADSMIHLRGEEGETYEEYYAQWGEQQKEHLQQLQVALESNMLEEEMKALVARVLKHYEDYYEVKGKAVKGNVLQLIHPSWRTPLEAAFLWIGGWRPTSVFQLAYAQSGYHLEQELAEMLRGVDTPTMASLSSKQLSQINNLQMKTQADEDELSERMAVVQQGLADQPLLGVALAGKDGDSDMLHNGMKGAFEDKFKALEELLTDADGLRLSTLREMLKILNTLQGAQYLTAAALMQVTIRNFGEEADKAHQHSVPMI